MDGTQLLQQVGLSQYEAEAYTSLLRQGPVTGYELGKRSKVPLPRIYDVLERLQRRGMVLVQPGDPPRYRAEDPATYLRQLRAGLAARLDELEAELLTLSPREVGEEFWVLRGRDQILARAAAMIETAEHSVGLRLPPALWSELVGVVEDARRRCPVLALDGTSGDGIVVLVDDRELLAGTVTDPAQAVVSRNRALVGLAHVPRPVETGARAAPSPGADTGADWLLWEADKQRRLQLLAAGSDAA
jgi:sugar-specific transcriptional regulator TrmB